MCEELGIRTYPARSGGRAQVGAGPCRYRRMSKDDEYLTSSSEAIVSLTMLRLMLTRLAKQNE